MDKEIRNRIQRATQDARRLLEEEYAEQLGGTFDILLDGRIGAEPGAHLDDSQRVIRGKLVAAIEHRIVGGKKPAEAVAGFLREAAFTTLNRFVALKMLEARELVQECVSRGEQSSGFKEFGGLARGLVDLPDHGYRMYIESLFDEIGREVRVLFDRRDPSSLLWPGRQVLSDLLAVLNEDGLADVWREDETIGWVYQYFNGDEERAAMRDPKRGGSQAPRNSRELAVRNQFFTPRYVVQFLTDNTLGRVWIQMMGGESSLSGLDYIVREEEPSRRQKKDPRDIRVLDPACGSGHFLLYACDLLFTIYEEAWQDQDASPSEATGRSLREDYANLEALRRATPELVLRHNLHGIDIDPRAAQVAALALWMRIQRAYADLRLSREDRPPINRMNVVVAEPMPSDAGLVEELAATLDPPVLGELFQEMVSEMQLAGEMGSLLKIENAIEEAVATARRQFVALQEELRKGYLPGFEPPRKQGELDLTGIDDERFFEEAGARIIAALHRFAESTAGAGRLRRQLFAGDAAHGVAFIELMQKRYDVVLMNPPFGASSGRTLKRLRADYPIGYVDLYTAFVDRGIELTTVGGLVGAITSRTGLFLARYEKWRRRTLLGQSHIRLLADFGHGVLDAMVETAAYIVDRSEFQVAWCYDCRAAEVHGEALSALLEGGSADRKTIQIDEIQHLPDASFAYWAGQLITDFRAFGSLSDIATVNKGGASGDDDRFVRLAWETPVAEGASRWRWVSKGGTYAPFYFPIHLRIDWLRDGDYLGQSLYLKRPREGLRWGRNSNTSVFQGRAGIFWPLRSQKGLSFRVLPRGTLVTHKSPFLAIDELQDDVGLALLGYLNSGKAQALADCLTAFGSYELGTVGSLPVDVENKVKGLSDAARIGVESARSICSVLETDPSHRALIDWKGGAHDSPAACLDSIVSQLDQDLEKLVESLHQIDSLLDYRHALTDYERVAFFKGVRDDISIGSLVSELVGIALGRWVGPEIDRVPEQRDTVGVWKELPRSPRTLATAYNGDGIAVDDEGHVRDLPTMVCALCESRWGGAGPDQMQDRLEAANGATFRSWIRDTYFGLHCDLHTWSRRKAPLYWQLATPSAGYSVWLYYHRFTRDTMYRVLNEYVTPKVEHEERMLVSLIHDQGSTPTAGQRKEREAKASFVSELRAFRDEVARVAPLWNPDLNDGVIINFAPLWRLVPQSRSWQRECKKVWDKLCKGEYDWAHLAMHLWPERVVAKCTEDRSLAIAHGLEDDLWFEGEDGKWSPREVPEEELAELVAARTSLSVKAALEDLVNAPAPIAGTKRRKAPKRKSRVASPSPEATGPRRSSARKTPRARRQPADEDTLEAIKRAIEAGDGGTSRAEVIAATGLTAAQWNSAIRVLLDRGDVVKTGERRGTRYFTNQRGGDDA